MIAGKTKIVGRLFKYSLVALSAFVVMALIALVFFEQPVPRVVLKHVCDNLSKGGMLVTAESASFRFSRGVKIRNMRVFDRHRHPMKAAEPVKPLLSASIVDLELNLHRIPWSWEHILLGVTITNLKYPRLPEGYYVPDSIEYPGQPDFKEKNEPVELSMPEIKPFRVTLLNPDILSVTPKYLELPSVSFTRGSMRIPQLHLQWADSDALMTLDGNVELDIEQQLVRGEVRGQARQHNIRPMLVALDILNSLQFMDAFTKVEPPVPSVCKYDVNLRNNDLHIFLDLHPIGGFHHGVPLKKVDGTVDIRVFVRDTYQNARIEVGSPEKPLDAQLADGTWMKGTVVYENTNDVGYVNFDVDSHTSLSNALAIADVMNDGTLDCLAPESTPHLTLKGRLAVNPKFAKANDLVGTVEFAKGRLFSVPLLDAAGTYHLKGTDVTFTNLVAKAPHGGTIEGGARITIPDFKQDHASFGVDLKCRGISLQDTAETFGINPDDRRGRIDADVTFTGPLATNLLERLCSEGHVVCREGHLAQMKLFAGLTDFLARNVPGISGVVNLSGGTMDYALTNGVLKVSDARIEGNLFSIHAKGAYDLINDRLDFTAQVKLARDQSILDRLATPIKWPMGLLSSMLLDFRVQGTKDNPTWNYNKNLMDRLRLDVNPLK